MPFDYGWFSATRVTGLAAFTASFMACAARWVRCRREPVSGRIFGILAGVELALLLDMAFDWRWKLHAAGNRKLVAMGVYPLRSTPQQIALAVLTVLVVLVSIFVISVFRHRRGAGLSVVGAVLSVGLWCVEVISYHFADQVLYQMVGNVLAIAVLWAGLAAITCFGVWVDGRAGRAG